jgi:biopolymer transport protein ExbB
MPRSSFATGRLARTVRTAALGLALAVVAVTGGGAGREEIDPRAEASAPAVAPSSGLDLDALGGHARRLAAAALAWYERTPPADRVTWGGLAAAAGLALGVLAERLRRLRPRRTLPDDFPARFLERLQDGRLDRGKALDYCELNPSPAARVALAAVKRWGRPVADLERAVALAHRVEAERLRRHLGTLRRVAALAPLLGLLGTLTAVSRTLAALGAAASATAADWGPALASALWPLTASVALATLALVAYDGLAGRVEQLSDALDRVGAETIDAIALALPLPVAGEPRGATLGAAHSHGAHGPSGPTRTPHQVRLEVPTRPSTRVAADDDDLD